MKKHHRLYTKLLVEDGYPITHGFREDLVLCKVRGLYGCRFVPNYQVHCDILKYSKLFNDFDEALDEFLRLKRKRGIEVARIKKKNQGLPKMQSETESTGGKLSGSGTRKS